MARMVHVRIKVSNGARSGTGTFSDDKIVASLLGTPSLIELMMVMLLLIDICSNYRFVRIRTGFRIHSNMM